MNDYLKQRKVWLWIVVNFVGFAIGGAVIAREPWTARFNTFTLTLCGSFASLLQAVVLYSSFGTTRTQSIRWLGVSTAGWSLAVPIGLLIQLGYAFVTLDVGVFSDSRFNWLTILIGGLGVSLLQARVLYPEERKYPQWEVYSAIGWVFAMMAGSIIVHLVPGDNIIGHALSGGIAGIIVGIITGWVLVKNEILDESNLQPRQKVVKHKALQIFIRIILGILFLLGFVGFIYDAIRTF